MWPSFEMSVETSPEVGIGVPGTDELNRITTSQAASASQRSRIST
jgi:hypothetical protein